MNITIYRVFATMCNEIIFGKEFINPTTALKYYNTLKRRLELSDDNLHFVQVTGYEVLDLGLVRVED